MAIVAHTYPFAIGVDTHARKRTYAKHQPPQTQPRW